MRFVRISLLAALSFGALACSEPDTGPFIAKIPPTAIVRYIHALPDTFPTTVRWIDDIEFTPQTFVGVGFREYGQGGWQGLKAGNRRFRVFTYQQNTNNFPVAGNTVVLKDTTFNFEAGKYYTILHTGFTRTGALPAAQLRIFEDEPPASPAAGTLLRVYNVAYTGDWDLYLGPTATQVVDTSTTNNTYTAPMLGTLVASTTAAAAGTVALPYAARATGNVNARITGAGSLVRLGTLATPTPVRISVPTGLAETADFEAAGGANVTGSVLTAWVFGARTTGSFGATGAFTRPSVMFTIDRSPARTVAP